MTATGSSAYKSWVTTLRAWSRDTSVSLDSLPPLNQDSFSPTTYNRVLDHMITAIGTMMRGWSDSFTRDWNAALGAGDLHGAEVALVEARRRLLPRLTLANHPGLPEKIRTALMTGLRKDVESIQKQLEEDMQDVSRFTTPTMRQQQEQLVRLVRTNSMERIFDGGYVDGSAIVRLADRVSAPGPAGGNPVGAPGVAVGAPGPAVGAPVSVNRAMGAPGTAPGPVVGSPTGTPGPPAGPAVGAPGPAVGGPAPGPVVGEPAPGPAVGEPGAVVGEPVNEAARAPGPAAPTGQTGRPRRAGLFGRRFR
ncbi:MAG: hypothetical protein DI576_06195 [Actinomyces sp.]|nr:MAG: hypothetical protein DI576_06195 [Actinomyces sp.]